MVTVTAAGAAAAASTFSQNARPPRLSCATRTVLFGHYQVSDEQIGRGAAEFAQSFPAVAGFADVVVGQDGHAGSRQKQEAEEGSPHGCGSSTGTPMTS